MCEICHTLKCAPQNKGHVFKLKFKLNFTGPPKNEWHIFSLKVSNKTRLRAENLHTQDVCFRGYRAKKSYFLRNKSHLSHVLCFCSWPRLIQATFAFERVRRDFRECLGCLVYHRRFVSKWVTSVSGPTKIRSHLSEFVGATFQMLMGQLKQQKPDIKWNLSQRKNTS